MFMKSDLFEFYTPVLMLNTYDRKQMKNLKCTVRSLRFFSSFYIKYFLVFDGKRKKNLHLKITVAWQGV